MKKKSEKRVSRKDAKAPRFGEMSKCLPLRAWREVFRELSMEFAVEAQKLLGVSLEGSVG